MEFIKSAFASVAIFLAISSPTGLYPQDKPQPADTPPTPSATSSTSPSPSPFVRVVGNQLYLGDQPYVVKGANYLGGRYINPYPKDANGIEVYDGNILRDFNEQGIEKELVYLKEGLGVNTIRIGTASVRPAPNDPFPWFLSDGSVNPVALQRFKAFLAIAARNNIKVHLSLFWGVQHIGWKCPGQGGTMQPCRPRPGEIGPTSTFIPVGSDDEMFYFKNLQTLIPQLKDDPTILSYEIGNEMLLNVYGVNSGNQNGWYQEKILSFMRRMTTAVRSLDQNHLINGEGGATVMSNSAADQALWRYPAPEFAQIADIDGLNGGQPYSLYSIVDYISPHFYMPRSAIAPIATAIKVRSTKPVVLGEFGWGASAGCCTTTGFHRPPVEPQTRWFEEIIRVSKQNGFGYQVWAPMPVFDLIPGTYRLDPWPDGTQRPMITFFGPPVRRIKHLGIVFDLFEWCAGVFGNQCPRPAAHVFAGDNATFVSQTVPGIMVAGQQYPVSIVIKNSGEKMWNLTGNQIYSYRIGSQGPQDNHTWGASRFDLSSAPVMPGQTTTINFTVTAPPKPGKYSFKWRMNQAGVGWFGDITPNVSVQVTRSATISPTRQSPPTPQLQPRLTPSLMPNAPTPKQQYLY